MGYVFTTHHTPLMVAAVKGEALKESGAYLAPMVPRQKYKIMSADGTPLAVLNFIVSKSGSETSTLFAMNYSGPQCQNSFLLNLSVKFG